MFGTNKILGALILRTYIVGENKNILSQNTGMHVIGA